MATMTACLFPIIAGIYASQYVVHDMPITLNPVNNTQDCFVENYWKFYTELVHFSKEELKSQSSGSVDQINRFLSSIGCGVSLENKHDPKAFYIASMLNMKLQWKQAGERTSLRGFNDRIYEATKLDSQCGCIQLSQATLPAQGSNIDILRIESANRDYVFMSPAKNHPQSEFELLETIEQFRNSQEVAIYPDTDVIFPNVEINHAVHIEWLKDLLYSDYYVAQAIQINKFIMDENGVTIATPYEEKHISKPVYVISHPFYLWIMRPGVTIPIFVAYVDSNCWKWASPLE